MKRKFKVIMRYSKLISYTLVGSLLICGILLNIYYIKEHKSVSHGVYNSKETVSRENSAYINYEESEELICKD